MLNFDRVTYDKLGAISGFIFRVYSGFKLRNHMFFAQEVFFPDLPSSKLTWLAGKWTMNEDVFPLEKIGYFIQPCQFTWRCSNITGYIIIGYNCRVYIWGCPPSPKSSGKWRVDLMRPPVRGSLLESRANLPIFPNTKTSQGNPNAKLVGGWTNPSEKYESKWESFPNRGGNKKNWSCHHLVNL